MFNCLMPPKFFCSMVHPRFMRYNNFRYCKFFCQSSTKFNDIKFSRYFKFCSLILPLDCLLDDVVQCFNFTPLFLRSSSSYILVATMFNIVMYVNCFHGDFFLMKIYRFNTLFGAHQVEHVILFIFKLS